MTKETWKPVVRWEKLYEVSSKGRIKSLRKGRMLKPCKHPSGYLLVSLNYKEIRKTVKIHRLVCLAFLENPENKRCVNHKDGNRGNNNLENLEWATHSENTIHGYVTGLRELKFKLTDSQIFEIIQYRSWGFKYREIAENYNINIDLAMSIVAGRARNHITGIKK